MTAKLEKRTLAVLVHNEPGVLARVVALFSGRGYNIDSLTVSEVDAEYSYSRVTIVVRATPQILDQIKAQLGRLIPVIKVKDLTKDSVPVERELVMVKVANSGDDRVESLRIADIYRANVIDSGLKHFVFELTGTQEKLDSFIKLMRELGEVTVSRSGVVAISRGVEGIEDHH